MVGWRRIVATVGERIGTVRSIALAWVLSLPMAMLIAGGLYWFFLHLF